MKRGLRWLMRKILFGVLAVLGIALAGCFFPSRPIDRTPVPGPPPRPAVTTEDLLKLTRADVGEQVIMEKPKTDGVVSAPSSDDLIALKKEGAGDRVIEAMLSARVGPPVVFYPFGFRHPW